MNRWRAAVRLRAQLRCDRKSGWLEDSGRSRISPAESRAAIPKRVSRAWLPSQIIRRKKQGFPIPLSAWFRHEARPFVRDVLSPSAVRRRGLFNPHSIQALLDRNERGDFECGEWLWALINVELWYRTFIDARHAPKVAAPLRLPDAV